MPIRFVGFHVSVIIPLFLFSLPVFAVPLSCDDFDSCGGGRSSDAVNGFLGFLFIAWGVWYWFSIAVSEKSARLWFTVIVGSLAFWLINMKKLIAQIIGWVLLFSVFLVWYWAKDSEGGGDRKQDTSITPTIKHPTANDDDGLKNTSQLSDEEPRPKPPSTSPSPDATNSPYFSDVPWSKDKFQAKQYRKLIANGYTFAREDSKVVATSPKGKRQVIYTSFQLDDLELIRK